jgi:hypothetical protein
MVSVHAWSLAHGELRDIVVGFVKSLMRDSSVGDWRFEAFTCLCEQVAGAMGPSRIWRYPTSQ